MLSNPISALNVCESPKFSRLAGNRVEEDNDDVRFYTVSRNTAVSRMRNEQYAT